MSDQAPTQVQAQQKTLIGVSPQSSLFQRTCACGQHTIAGSECEGCRQKREGTMQRAVVSSAPVNAVPPVVHGVLSSPSQPLDAGTRTFMESRFGHDFSQVRVHTDERAAESARAVNALAYTLGQNIVFGEGLYTPRLGDGQRLLAHELAHVIQQERGGTTPPSLIPGNPLEQEARLAAKAVTQGQDRIKVAGASAQGLARETNEEREKLLKSNALSHPSRIPKAGASLFERFPPSQIDPELLKSWTQGTKSGKEGPEFVSENYTEVRDNPQYIDNFTNDINDAWLPNDRVFVFQYPNGALLKIALVDLVKALNVSSDLNPQLSEADLRKKYKIPDDLDLPKSDSPTPFIAIGKAQFYRDKESQVIYPSGKDVYQSHLPHISHAVKQIESVRVNEELWQRAAPKLLEIITSMEWSAPVPFGRMLVRLGKGMKRGAKATKDLIVKPGTPKPPEPHVSVPKPPEPHISVPKPPEAGAAEKAAQVIEEEAIKTGKLADYTFERGGHTWQILKDGSIVRCSKWCTFTSLEEAFGDLIQRHPHLNDAMTKLKKLKGKAAAEEATNLGKRMDQIGKAERMSLDDLEKLLDKPEFAKGTPMGNDLRFVRYQKQGGKLGFEEWEPMAYRLWENTGTLREKELKKAFGLGPKNKLAMVNPDPKKASFIPDHIGGNPTNLEWGKPYHFEEIKDWADMSDTGNLSAMLDYVDNISGSQLTIYYKSNTYMSGPLRNRIEGLMKKGKVELIPFIGE